MSFLDCIAIAQRTGKIGQNKADEISELFEQKLAELDHLPGDKDTAAAMAALTEATEMKSAARRARVAQMRAEHTIFTELESSRKKTSALAGHNIAAPMDNLGNKIDFLKAATFNMILAKMDGLVKAFDAKFLGFVKPLENMDEIADHVYGEGQPSPAAKALGEQYKGTQDYIRKILNLAGAFVPENPEYKMPQSHDRLLVHQAGKEQWVFDHMQKKVLAWDIMRYHGKPIAMADRQAILEKVWDSIVSEGKADAAHAFAPETLMQRLNRERFLYYDNAQAWKDMNAKYGRGNAYTQLLDHAELAAKQVALMTHLGPSPERGRQFAIDSLNHLVGQERTNLPVDKSEKLRVQAEREVRAFNQMMDMEMSKVNQTQGDPIVQVANGARSMVGAAMLGNVLFTHLSQAFTQMWFRQLFRLPFISTIPKYMHAMINGGDFKAEAIHAGLGFETVRQGLHDSAHLTMASKFEYGAGKLSEANYRATLTSRWLATGRVLIGMDLAHAMAKFSHLPMDAFDKPGGLMGGSFAELMRNMGITPEDWDRVRGTEKYQPEYYDGVHYFGKANYLRPIDMFNNARDDATRRSAQKFLMLQEMAAHGAMPGPSLRARAFIGGSFDANTVAGQFMRASTQFMVMPASSLFTQWRLAANGANFTQRAVRFGLLMAYTAAAGAAIVQIKEALKNRTPQDMDPRANPGFWARAAMQGGGAGILGDFVYNNLSAADGPFSASNPMAETGKTLYNANAEIVKAVMQGAGFGQDWKPADPGGAALKAAWELSPKPQPLRFAIERMMYDPLLQHVDPAAWERKRANELKVMGQQGQEDLINFQQ